MKTTQGISLLWRVETCLLADWMAQSWVLVLHSQIHLLPVQNENSERQILLGGRLFLVSFKVGKLIAFGVGTELDSFPLVQRDTWRTEAYTLGRQNQENSGLIFIWAEKTLGSFNFEKGGSKTCFRIYEHQHSDCPAILTIKIAWRDFKTGPTPTSGIPDSAWIRVALLTSSLVILLLLAQEQTLGFILFKILYNTFRAKREVIVISLLVKWDNSSEIRFY